MVAEKIAQMTRGYPKQTGPIGPILSKGQAAELLNVSEHIVKRARTVREHGVPELIDAVQSGRMAVTPAAEIAKLPPEEQKGGVGLSSVPPCCEECHFAFYFAQTTP